MRYFYLLLKTSRPRFWLYLVGTFWVGIAIGAKSFTDFLNPWIYMLLFYFLFPANIYLYGINDMFDQETDALNEKKGTQEILLKKNQLPFLKKILSIIFIFTIFLIIFAPSLELKILLSVFCLLSTFYSAPPLRFKTHPFVDFASNILYAIPGYIGFYVVTSTVPPISVIATTFLWTSAMHLFSAIPDISADKAASLKTTAVVLGERTSLLLCLFMWVAFACICLYSQIAFPFTLLFLIYPIMVSIVLTKKIASKRIYWWFPYVTGILGFIFFWYFWLTNLL